MTNYLQVNYDGTIYQYSSTEKQGFVPYTNKNDKTSYRKYFNKGVEGQLTGAYIKQNPNKNNAEEAYLVLNSGEVTNHLVFPLLNQKGDSLDDYAEALAVMLPKLEVGRVYNINNWFMKKGDNINGEEVKYNKKGITVKLEGEKIKTDLTFEHVKGRGTAEEKHVPGDVPMLKWELIAGKNRPTAVSKENRLKFLYDLVTSNITRLGGTSNTTNASAPANVGSQPQASTEPDIAPDDLPF